MRCDSSPAAAADISPSSLTLRAGVSQLDLCLERDASNPTRPTRCLVQAPLQLSRVRYDDPDHPEMAVVTLLHLGGVLAGDRTQLQIALGVRAMGRVRMAAATQVLRMSGGAADQKLDVILAAGSSLEWLAEPLILFGGSRFTQTTRIVLGSGAHMVLLDILVPGRLARGERFAFDAYHARLEVSDPAGRLLLAERAHLEPARQHLAAPGVLGATPVVGSLYLLGEAFAIAALAARLGECGDATLAATVLPNNCGLLVRALGTSASSVRQALRARLATARSYGAGC